MKAILTVVCLLLATPALAQNSNPRFNSVSVGTMSADIDLDGPNSRIKLPTGGTITTASSVGNCFTLQAIDTDTGTGAQMAILCAGPTPTFDLNPAVTIGGQALLPFTDPGAFDSLFYLRNSDNTLQPVTIGTGLTFTGGTLAAPIPAAVLAGWFGCGFLSSAWLLMVAVPRWHAWRLQRRRWARA